MKIIVGLGNPGKKYETTRHNAGFRALDALTTQYDLRWREDKKLEALMAEGDGFLLIKPQTFMNNSGRAVAKVLNYYHATATDDLLVIHDELDLPLGAIKKASSSSSAGHRGVQSIIDNLKTKDFVRFRLGVKTDDLNKIRLGIFKTTPDKFVLATFPKSELKELDKAVERLIPLLDL